MERIDRVLIDSSLEREAIVKALEGWDEAGGKDRERRALRALRVEVVRHLLGGISFRCLSQELGRSELLANFCRVREVDGIRKISKSSLERDSKFFDEAYLEAVPNPRGFGTASIWASHCSPGSSFGFLCVFFLALEESVFSDSICGATASVTEPVTLSPDSESAELMPALEWYPGPRSGRKSIAIYLRSDTVKSGSDRFRDRCFGRQGCC